MTTSPPSTTTPPPPTTAPAPRDEDVEPDPPEKPRQAPSGRVVVPGGRVDGGEVRPITFPVAGPVSYGNDFGACRDGCARAHQGNDVIGDRLQPLLAMHDGVIDHLVDHPTAGYGVVIRDAEGWEYRIYHVNNDTPGSDDGAHHGRWTYPPGIQPGAQVRAGQLIGWMGDSGNSEHSVPHAHVEIHRPDGTPINPFWSLRRAQRDVNCARGEAPAAADMTGSAWLDRGWAEAPLPRGWQPLALTGGHPGSGQVEARMWVSPLGHTPVDAGALRAGDPRYDEPGQCAGAGRDDTNPAVVPAELAAVLATIRSIESGGDYTAESRSSSASGAYQFVDDTWNGYGGYARAVHAPPEVQDAKAAEWATHILESSNGDVSAVPVVWYLGHVPVGDEWDRIPPYPGNTLTPREYQQRWLATYEEIRGQPPTELAVAASGWTPVDITNVCHTVLLDVGAAGEPAYVLTQAQRFRINADGRATPAATDPCDPSRPRPTPAPNVVEFALPAPGDRRVASHRANRRR